MLSCHLDGNSAVLAVGGASGTATKYSHVSAGHTKKPTIEEALDGCVEERTGRTVRVNINNMEPSRNQNMEP